MSRREKYRYLESERGDDGIEPQQGERSQQGESEVIQMVSEPIQHHRLKRLVCRIETALAWNSSFSILSLRSLTWYKNCGWCNLVDTLEQPQTDEQTYSIMTCDV